MPTPGGKVLTVRAPVTIFRRFKRYLAGRDRSTQEQLLGWIDRFSQPNAGTQGLDSFEGGPRDKDATTLMEEDRQHGLCDDARWQR